LGSNNSKDVRQVLLPQYTDKGHEIHLQVPALLFPYKYSGALVDIERKRAPRPQTVLCRKGPFGLDAAIEYVQICL